MIGSTSEKMVPADWAKCINPKGLYGPLIAVIQNSDWLGKSTEPVTFMECIQRAQDVDRWLKRPAADTKSAG